MASGMLPDQPNNTKGAKVLHPPYAGEVFEQADASSETQRSCLQVLPLIPITALVIQNSVNMNTLLGYQNRVSTIRRQVKALQYFKAYNSQLAL